MIAKLALPQAALQRAEDVAEAARQCVRDVSDERARESARAAALQQQQNTLRKEWVVEEEKRAGHMVGARSAGRTCV